MILKHYLLLPIYLIVAKLSDRYTKEYINNTESFLIEPGMKTILSVNALSYIIILFKEGTRPTITTNHAICAFSSGFLLQSAKE